MDTMKRCLAVALALAFGLASGVALADSTAPKTAAAASKAVQMTDAEMDNVTAGSAIVAIAVFNRGNGFQDRLGQNPSVCVNCVDLGLQPTAVLLDIVNAAGRTVVSKCVGSNRIC